MTDRNVGPSWEERVSDWAAQCGIDPMALLELRTLLSEVPPTAPPVSHDPDHGQTLSPVTERYERVALLGEGGMGEVWTCFDAVLQRTVALKQIRSGLADGAVARFIEESQVTGQLQHPGIVPILDLATDDQGNWFYTMPVVQGRTLHHELTRFHRASVQRWALNDTMSLPRLLQVVLNAASAVAYAHDQGVVHRDLKPDNIMVGAFGQAYVLDWGIAALTEDSGVSTTTGVPRAHRRQERSGTPAFMPVEQRSGVVEYPCRVDVYALGGILAYAISGRLPSAWSGESLHPVPTGLVELIASCLTVDPSERPPDGAAVVRALQRVLDGAERRDRALVVWEQAEVKQQEWHRAQRAETDAKEAMDHAADRAAYWEAVALLQASHDEAERCRTDWEQLVTAALSHDDALTEARAALVSYYWQSHKTAEAEQRSPTSVEGWLRTHLDKLPNEHSLVKPVRRYLQGEGTIYLGDVPGDTRVVRLEDHGPDRVETTAIVGSEHGEFTVSPGAYWVEQLSPDGPVGWSLLMQRNGRWSPELAPGKTGSSRLPSDCPSDACFIPAGWSRQGAGSETTQRVLKARRVWVDAFVMQTQPVTLGEYLVFLEHLRSKRGEAVAVEHAPAYPGGGASPVQIDANGVQVVPDHQGDLWDLRWPVFLVSAANAEAYAAWWSARTGLAWRLPTEVEWEKAARGDDGRQYPWGNHLEPHHARMSTTPPGPSPASVDTHPADVSVYGVRGLGGNVMDWTADPFHEDPQLMDGRPQPLTMSEHRVAKGGAWMFHADGCRSAARYHPRADDRREDLSFRLVFSVES